MVNFKNYSQKYGMYLNELVKITNFLLYPHIQGKLEVICQTKEGDIRTHLDLKTQYKLCYISNRFRGIADRRKRIKNAPSLKNPKFVLFLKTQIAK